MGIPVHQYVEMLARVGRNALRDGPAAADAEPHEADLHDKIMDECRRRGWVFVHARMDKRTTTACGVPDFVIGADSGRVFWVEAKSKTGKLTTAQLGFMAMALSLGLRAFSVRSLREFLEIVEIREKGQ